MILYWYTIVSFSYLLKDQNFGNFHLSYFFNFRENYDTSLESIGKQLDMLSLLYIIFCS